MRRFLSLLALAAVLAVAERAASQPGGEFGVLNPTPAAPPPRALPAGVEPVHQAASARVNAFPLNAQAGPWLVCAVTYIGHDGDSLSRQVAQQLQGKHNLPVYIFNRGEEERKKQHEEWEALRKQYPGT